MLRETNVQVIHRYRQTLPVSVRQSRTLSRARVLTSQMGRRSSQSVTIALHCQMSSANTQMAVSATYSEGQDGSRGTLAWCTL